MSRRQWSVEEKLHILQEAEAESALSVCRNHGISGNTFYKWKHAYEEAGVSGLKPKKRGPHSDPEQKRLEKENERLKKILAEKELELQIKEELLKKTMQRRQTKCV